LTSDVYGPQSPELEPARGAWVRGSLAGVGLGLTAVFAIALCLDPYRADGTPRRMETHRQLGLPPCTFYAVTGLPCPSCGMTTSFALLVRGDLKDSARANAVGTLLALLGLVLIPWCGIAVFTGRTLYVRSLERALTMLELSFLGLMLLRWAVLIATGWWRPGTG
jgi:hypothetical protein